MKEVAQLLNDMVVYRVIDNCAIFGTVAQMRYTEAVATVDVGVFVAVPESEILEVAGKALPVPLRACCLSRICGSFNTIRKL